MARGLGIKTLVATVRLDRKRREYERERDDADYVSAAPGPGWDERD